MKRISFFIFFMFVSFSCILCARDIIKNPEKPNNPAAGRIIKLKKVLEIPGAGDNYVIIHPYDLDFSSDGKMYLTDEGQLLVFTPDGLFLKNLYRKGQGPGELLGKKVDAEIRGDKLYIFDPVSKKIIISDLKGKLIQEKKLIIDKRPGTVFKFIGLHGDELLFWRSSGLRELMKIHFKRKELPGTGSKLIDLKNTLFFHSLNTGKEKIIGEFPTKHLLSRTISPLAQLRYIIYNDKLLLTHTPEYLVKIVALKSGKIKEISRKYKRVEITLPNNKRRQIQDISGIYVYKNYIWIKTSSRDQNKGCLYDVFDFEGRYVDSFHLGINGFILSILGDCLFISLVDEDDNRYIVKYKVLDYYKPEMNEGR